MLQPTVLLVDDEEDFIELLSDTLEDKYKILTANDAETALSILEQSNVSLVISDVMMSGINGFELCDTIKSDIGHSHIPVILLTARNAIQDKIEGLNNGADVYIEKPFNPEYLGAQVDSLLNNRKKIKEHFSKQPVTKLISVAQSTTDENFLNQLNTVIEYHINNPVLDVEFLSSKMAMSKSSLYRKIQSTLDLTPHELISLTRLKKAAELIAKRSYMMNEIAMMVGYSSGARFSKSFKQQFGISPSEYAQLDKHHL
ncbi:response regulator [Niabella sp. CJ426]|uniref:response regulator transcription factor n=1 Tax=Niabella sp. CJ426 TaxID=3393740 RepID=UPI003CFCE069